MHSAPANDAPGSRLPRGPRPHPGGPSGGRFPSFGGDRLGRTPDDDDGGRPPRGAASPSAASHPREPARSPERGRGRPPSPRRSLFTDFPSTLRGARPGRPASVSAEDMPIPIDTASGRPPGSPAMGSSAEGRPFLDDLGIGPRSMAGRTSSPLGGGGLGPPGPEKKVSFEAEAESSRRGRNEERRGEADAGGMLGRRI